MLAVNLIAVVFIVQCCVIIIGRILGGKLKLNHEVRSPNILRFHRDNTSQMCSRGALEKASPVTSPPRSGPASASLRQAGGCIIMWFRAQLLLFFLKPFGTEERFNTPEVWKSNSSRPPERWLMVLTLRKSNKANGGNEAIFFPPENPDASSLFHDALTEAVI